MRPAYRVGALTGFALVCAVVFARLLAQEAPRERPLPPSVRERLTLTCATDGVRESGRPRLDATGPSLVDGEPLSFEQFPPLLTPDYAGEFGLRRFLVAGDYATIQFRRFDPDNPDYLETWERTTTAVIAGNLVSVFEPTWQESDLAAALRRSHVGLDQPELYWGRVIAPNPSHAERSVWLRMSFSAIPSSQVRRLSDRVQYASNVVNLVLPDFDDVRITNGLTQFNFTAASRLFYESFADQYESLGFVPAATILGDFSAYHRNVKNAVSGLALNVFDQSAQYGSGGTLQGIEVYSASHLIDNSAATHEFAHQWADHFNWARIARIVPAGHQPSAHSPLWWAGETLIGAVLTADRRVKENSTAFEIERTPVPIRYHPIEMYSMGLISREQVPDIRLFQNQGQFSTGYASTPAVGTGVQGETTTVTIDDIIREHGVRSGPSPSNWHRATIIVSREELVSQREMDYWNFFSQRLGDRNHTGVLSVDGYGTPFSATGGKVTVSTAIQPRSGDALPEVMEIDAPAFGPRDFRGVALTNPMPSRFTVGQTTTIAGRVTATDPVDFTQALLTFHRWDAVDEAVRPYAAISRSGDFSINVSFTPSQRGRYLVGMVLFWPNSGPQYARTYLTPVIVE